MSQIGYANPQAAKPELGVVKGVANGTDDDVALRAQLAAGVPLTLSAVVHLMFFLAYWIPETSAVPGRVWWLTQLSPMVSSGLTSLGHPQVPIQVAQSGVPGAILLVCAIALRWLSRTRHWLGRSAMLVPAALGLIVSVVTWVALAISSTFSATWLGVLVMFAWSAAAGYAGLRGGSHAVVGHRTAKTWRNGMAMLVGYALIGPLPTAVGRLLFAPDLRDAAAGLEANTVSLRLAALWTPSTVLLYLVGLLVGVTIWVGYQWWPPRRRVSFVGWTLALVASLIATGALGWPANTVAERRVTRLLYASPATAVHFTCGAWILTPAGPGSGGSHEGQPTQPAVTLAANGFNCRTVTIFRGYRQLATRTLAASVSPVKAVTPEGVTIQGRSVSAQYGPVLVLAGSDRLDGHANQLIGLRTADAAELWHYTCPGSHVLSVRFAAVPTGDRPELGQLTVRERTPTVLVRCNGQNLRFNPTKGLIG